MKIKIGSHEIGDGYPPFIVAEVGSNWRTLDDCLHSIRTAKECGADAVKFQLLDEKALYGIDVDAVRLKEYQNSVGGYQFSTVDSHDMKPIREMAQLKEWLPTLKAECDRCQIEFMCSAFSPELIDAVDNFVNVHKVASAEMCHVRMLERLREIGKPVFLSTGSHTAEEIGKALEYFKSNNLYPNCECTGPCDWDCDDSPATPVVLLYCVAAYPARTIDLYQIHTLRNQFKTPAGYSDHSTDVENIPVLAQSHGAVVIEKHVTFIEAETPDSPHSLNADEFKRMVFAIRNEKYKAIDTPLDAYSPWKGPTPDQSPMVLRHNRRLLATSNIAVGETLREGINFGIYRSLKDAPNSLSPFRVAEVHGKVAKREIAAGDAIAEEDFG